MNEVQTGPVTWPGDESVKCDEQWVWIITYHHIYMHLLAFSQSAFLLVVANMLTDTGNNFSLALLSEAAEP